MKSPRKEVAEFSGNGILRSILEQHHNGLSPDGINLIVRVVLNYCENRPKRRKFLKRY